MRSTNPLSRCFVITRGAMLGASAVLAVAAWAVAPASVTAADAPAPKAAVDQKDQNGWGRFVSFKDGALTLESNAGVLLAWGRIPDGAKILQFDAAAGEYKGAAGAPGDVLAKVKAGTVVSVRDKKATIRIGARKGQTTGTFVSFKDGRLLMLGKDLGVNSYTRKYGNNVHYNKFRDDVPAYESVDGGEYKLVGTANKVLAEVKDGTVLTVHGEGDDNITLVQIGVPKK